MFPARHKNKLVLRADGPFELFGHINDNEHKVDLPWELRSFGYVQRSQFEPIWEDEYLHDLRLNPLKQAEDQPNMYKLSPLGQRSSSNQVQVQGTN